MKTLYICFIICSCVFSYANTSNDYNFPELRSIKISLDNKVKFDYNEKTLKAIVSIIENDKYPQIKIIHCLKCYDAKFDKQTGKLAIIYNNGYCAMHNYYKLQDNKWILLKRTGLFGNMFAPQGNYPKFILIDLNKIKITISYWKSLGINFMKENNIKKKDIEETYIMKIKDDGKTFINDKERTLALDKLRDYITEEDKARISKLKKQKEEWLKEKHSETE